MQSIEKRIQKIEQLLNKDDSIRISQLSFADFVVAHWCCNHGARHPIAGSNAHKLIMLYQKDSTAIGPLFQKFLDYSAQKKGTGDWH